MENCTDIINRAWQRVTGSEADAGCALPPCRCEYTDTKSRDANGMLREFISAERNFTALFDSLLRRAHSRYSASVFKQIICDSRTHMKKLQTEYFLLTCDTYCPPTEKPSVKTPVCAVREAYIRKIKSANAYRRAAKDSLEPSFSAALEHFACDEERHAASLKNLLEYIMN